MGGQNEAGWARRNGLVLVTGVAAALPVIVSVIRALDAGWVPVGDDAVIAIRSLDVLTTHSPLVGQFSLAAGGGPVTHSLGPLLYWLLTIPAHIGPAALVLTMGLVNVASVMGAVALARRRGGTALMFAVAAGVALMCGSLVPDTLHSIWNPSAAQLPLLLLMFVAWSVACGDHRLLPLGVLLGSFAVQCHLTYVPPVLAMAAVALVGLRLAVRERRELAPGLRRSVVIALVVGAVCWIAPVIDQVVERPGNFAAVGRAATTGQAKLGVDAGWNTVSRSVGVVPWWLREPQDPFTRLVEVVTPPPAATQVTAALVIAALVGAFVVALRRRRAEVVTLAALALALVLSLSLVATSTPATGGLDFTVSYTLRWSSPAGLFAWMAAVWSWAVLALPRRTRVTAPVRRFAPAVALGATAVVAVVVAAGLEPDLIESRYEPARRLNADVARAVTPDAPVAVRGDNKVFDMAAGLLYDTRRRGGSVRAPKYSDQLGESYGGPVGRRQLVTIEAGPRRGPGRLVARYRLPVVGVDRPQDLPVTVTIDRP